MLDLSNKGITEGVSNGTLPKSFMEPLVTEVKLHGNKITSYATIKDVKGALMVDGMAFNVLKLMGEDNIPQWDYPAG